MLDKEFVKEVLSIPSCTEHEERVRDFILSWANEQSIDSYVDGFGNVYLTKGKPNDSEFYPCLTSHMDTVHTENIPLIEDGKHLEIIDTDGVLWCEHGIGGDDKAGISICLSIMKELDMIKACFFVQEEPGCLGSENLDEEWFKDVGYVIAYDSPGYNRSAFACSGVMLFDKEFFHTNVQPTFERFGITNFYSEPCTDIENIRIKVGVACINIGAGYHNQHTKSEICRFDEMVELTEVGFAMISKLGNRRYDIPCSGIKYDFDNEDYKYFSSLVSEHDSLSDYEKELTNEQAIVLGLYYDVMTKCDEVGVDFSLFEDIFTYYLNNIVDGGKIHTKGSYSFEIF